MSDEHVLDDDRWFEEIRHASLIDLVTFTADGRAIPTPVRFAVDERRLVVSLDRSSGKVKRVRKDRTVVVVRHPDGGTSRRGQLRLLDGAEAKAAYDVLRRRHPLLFVQRLAFGRRPHDHVTAEIRFD